ncbi:hypothetical protein ACFRCX_30790 [Streptomyces sp. NPDC056652]|uniref:hypothetical protein n=1 Tax=Streptomyces sp. NPDC056652 TaxID=3345893 RepID=UPI0036CE733C
MGTDEAAHRLRLLQQEFTTLPACGPGDGRTGRRVHPPVPLNLAVIDHITASVREVAEQARTAAPEAGPLPAAPASIYDWWRQNTPDLDDGAVQARETVIYRQSLEHAIAAGDHKVIRKHPCPGCGCWGLFWRPAAQRAVCVNLDCTDTNGMARTWELKHLAYEHIARQKMLKANAT